MPETVVALLGGPTEHPPVVRFLPEQYVAEFFDAGKIRLSSFSQFARHEDERKDDKEGFGVVWVSNGPSPQFPDGSTEMNVMRLGRDSYILSACRENAIASRPVWMGRYGIRIVRPVEFAVAIAQTLPQPCAVVLGPCKYQEHRDVMRRNVGEFDLAAAKAGRLSLNDLGNRALAVASFDLMMIKLSRFAQEAEFRFIWRGFGEVDGTLDLICPAAVQFCERYVAAEP